MTKRKVDYPQIEVEIETGVVAGAPAPAELGGEGMEPSLFEDLLESVKEAGAILRGEQEAARIARFEESGDVTVVIPGGADVAGSSECDA